MHLALPREASLLSPAERDGAVLIAGLLAFLFTAAAFGAACHLFAALRPDLASPAFLHWVPVAMAHAQIAASFAALWLLLRGNPRRAAALALAGAIGFAIEWVGIRSGFPFGSYAYSSLLWPKLFGVPCVMALSWANISVSSHLLAGSGGRLRRTVIGAALMVAWDLTIDPEMGRLYPFWTWASPGRYYGIPATNYLGWFACAVAFMLLYDVIGIAGARWRPDPRLARLYYAANVSASLALAFAARLWLALGLTAAVLAGALALRENSERRVS